MDKEALNMDPSMAPAPSKKKKAVKSVSTFDPSKDALKHLSTPIRKKMWQVSHSLGPHENSPGLIKPDRNPRQSFPGPPRSWALIAHR